MFNESDPSERLHLRTKRVSTSDQRERQVLRFYTLDHGIAAPLGVIKTRGREHMASSAGFLSLACLSDLVNGKISKLTKH